MENIKFNMDQFPLAVPSTKGFVKTKLYVKEGKDMLYVTQSISFGEIK